MRIDMNTPVSVLIHGGNINYIDLDEGELYHWKYIKREKLSNGKYRYYYDIKDALGYDERDKFIKTAKDLFEAEDIVRDLKRKKESGKKVSNDLAQAHVYADQMRKKAEAARNAYKNTVIGSMHLAQVKLTIAYRRAKSWLSNLFK